MSVCDDTIRRRHPVIPPPLPLPRLCRHIHSQQFGGVAKRRSRNFCAVLLNCRGGQGGQSVCTVGLMLSGCVVEDTMPGSPAFSSGQIGKGDVITEVRWSSCVVVGSWLLLCAEEWTRHPSLSPHASREQSAAPHPPSGKADAARQRTAKHLSTAMHPIRIPSASSLQPWI